MFHKKCINETIKRDQKWDTLRKCIEYLINRLLKRPLKNLILRLTLLIRNKPNIVCLPGVTVQKKVL
jgi:hypothetical protein